jgi:hypothetical protein
MPHAYRLVCIAQIYLFASPVTVTVTWQVCQQLHQSVRAVHRLDHYEAAARNATLCSTGKWRTSSLTWCSSPRPPTCRQGRLSVLLLLLLQLLLLLLLQFVHWAHTNIAHHGSSLWLMALSCTATASRGDRAALGSTCETHGQQQTYRLTTP